MNKSIHNAQGDALMSQLRLAAMSDVDAKTTMVGLPTYTQLVQALNELAVAVSHHRQITNSDPILTLAKDSTKLVSSALE